MEVFDAEFFAIREAVHQLREFLVIYYERENCPIRKVFIFSDSQSGLKRIHNLTIRLGQLLIQKLINDLLWITNKFQIIVRFEWVPGHSRIRGNEIVNQLAKEAIINKDDKLPDNGYISLIYVKVSVRKSCLRDWIKYTMKMHRKKRMRRFYMQHFGIRFTHWKAYKIITVKRIYAALN
jgi:ribonuclease HI